ncbi:hypothetical protein [Microbacterium sp. UBA3394]|uniref:hypothetical protein n=1 Tax=Microbacterium sp. UBA3394 TaxID=1946945 RepID=UPI00257ED8A9|nr:hypothetical protein [Microbacterium sp. UBA3394]|tara:strand:+ start:3801 stop:3959 length:159 start_codon:yes stop_codon:yes gene_type:complete
MATEDPTHRHDDDSAAPGPNEGTRGAGSESPEEGDAAMDAAEEATVGDRGDD